MPKISINDLELGQGRPKKLWLKDMIAMIVDEKQYGTVSQIKLAVDKKCGAIVSWNTVQKYLEELSKEKRIKKKISASTTLYMVNELEIE